MTARESATDVRDMRMEHEKDVDLYPQQPTAEAMQTALQSYHLSQGLQPKPLREYFLNIIFEVEVVEIHDNFEPFFNRYALFCQSAAIKNPEIKRASHWQLAKIITLLHHRDLRKDAIYEECTSMIEDSFSLTPLHGSMLYDLRTVLIELAATVWVMLAIGEYPSIVTYDVPDEPIQWDRDQKLIEDGDKIPHQKLSTAVFNRYFSSNANPKDKVKLPQAFTAANLEQIGGIEIVWTSNLADHLLLTKDDTKLLLFHHVSTLELHLKSTVSILPKTLVEETIRSISLLMPTVLEESNPWFKTQKQKHPLVDSRAGICKRLSNSERQIERFQWWRDRLINLKRTFDEAEPRNISQLWWDDRKKTQWFTFWVAVLVFIMTVFFGIIQSVASIVQAWASVQSLKAQNAPSPD